MIRALFKTLLLLAALILGLGIAALTQGRYHHAQTLFGDALPNWTKTLDQNAGFRDGTAQIAPDISLHWRFKGLSIDGVQYRVRIAGTDLALNGNAALPYLNEHAKITSVMGTAALRHILINASDIPLSGTVHVTDLALDINLKTQKLTSFSAQGRADNLRLDGVPLSAATIQINSDSANLWRGQITMNDGPLPLSIAAQGALDLPDIQISATVKKPDRHARKLAALVGSIDA